MWGSWRAVLSAILRSSSCCVKIHRTLFLVVAIAVFISQFLVSRKNKAHQRQSSCISVIISNIFVSLPSWRTLYFKSSYVSFKQLMPIFVIPQCLINFQRFLANAVKSIFIVCKSNIKWQTHASTLLCYYAKCGCLATTGSVWSLVIYLLYF